MASSIVGESKSGRADRGHICGPVWCVRRGRNAVVTLVKPSDGSEPYVQWCSLVGVDLACDERCVSAGARWVEEMETAGLTRDGYLALSDLVAAVDANLEATQGEMWRQWARSFRAGLCSASAAWRAAEAARHESIDADSDSERRRAMLAAEDAAWAVVHAATGNHSLSLQRSGAARRLLKGPGS